MKEYWINEYENNDGKRHFGVRYISKEVAVLISFTKVYKLIGRWHVKLK